MIDFKEQILPRIIMVVILTPVMLLLWWLYSVFNGPSAEEIWQQNADALPVLSTDSQIEDAIKGEPHNYIVQNYKFSRGTTVQDTILGLLQGDYLVIDIRHQVFTITRGSSDSNIEQWVDGPYCTLVGRFAFNNGVEIRNAEMVKFVFSSEKFWQNLKPECVDPEKLGNVSQEMYYYPDRTMNFDSIGAIVNELPERFEQSMEQTVDQAFQRRKQYDTRYTLSFLKQGDPVTFAVRLGGGTADFNVFDDNNYILVGCDNMSQTSSTQSAYMLGWNIGIILIAIFALFGIIFAPKLLFDN